MDSDQGKLFVGGISWETSEEKLKEYFGQYGDVVQANVMRDKVTGRPRGFGFVLFSDPNVVDRVVLDKHSIDGRPVEVKKAMSREEQQNSGRSGYSNGGRSADSGGNLRTKKIFVGGLPPTLTDEGFRQYFENYGVVSDVVIMYDQNTQRPRGFGFIIFDNEEAVDMVLHKTFHDIEGKQVEVKRALPKDSNLSVTNRGSSGGSGNYGYNSSSNQNSYDNRPESNRYMQSQNAGGGYPLYGSSGYGEAGYGYAPVNNSMGYGGYVGYANAGVGRSPWNGQAASGYGATGYGIAGAWGSTGGAANGPTGQSPNAVSGYGNQGYGYGNYGGGDGSYGRSTLGNNVSGASGEMQGNFGGYDVNGHRGYGGGVYGVPNNGSNGGQMG